LPPDANTLLASAEHCFASRGYVNLIIASKSPMPQWLALDEARAHCKRGASAWDWAGQGSDRPQLILACAGDVPTLEVLAAARILREHAPELRFRVVNVVDLFALTQHDNHPHGLSDTAFQALFGQDTPVVLAFHGYPRVIHELIHHRPSPERFHVRGYEEEGTTTTPFDMVVRNRISRFQLAELGVQRALEKTPAAERVRAWCSAQLARHTAWIAEHGEDMPEIREWSWAPA
jgi:xylulose-5-phosphate/fructose-6-phosphate phosphoketolase